MLSLIKSNPSIMHLLFKNILKIYSNFENFIQELYIKNNVNMKFTYFICLYFVYILISKFNNQIRYILILKKKKKLKHIYILSSSYKRNIKKLK